MRITDVGEKFDDSDYFSDRRSSSRRVIQQADFASGVTCSPSKVSLVSFRRKFWKYIEKLLLGDLKPNFLTE